MRWALMMVVLLAVQCSSNVEKKGTAPQCGDGVLNGGETCDPGLAAGSEGVCPSSCESRTDDACAAVVLVGDPDDCTAECVTGEPACGLMDGCCPDECDAEQDGDCAGVCGDGVVDEGEECDGDCPTACDDQDVCTDDRLDGTAADCSATCVFVPKTSQCVDGDGCCPPTCDRSTDNDCPSSCGDGVVSGDETCDGDCPRSCDEGDNCTVGFLTGADETCDVECMYVPITACVDDDGCCPDGCAMNDNDCADPCTSNSCMANEICNTNTGLCEVANCPGEDPNQCNGNNQRPLWDPIRCFCAECVDDSQCDQAAGETCNAAGNCFACQTTCDPNTPGTCQGNTPYCINDCCVECVGAADCAMGQLCLDGFCGDPPNCQVDPSVCPTGYTCNANGQCEAPQTGQTCDPNDPMSCPAPGFCDPATSTCSGGGGGAGCGLCNPDCTCPDAAFTCNGYYCTAPDPAACLQCSGDQIACANALLMGEVVCLPN